ncbi:MAG: hypothetical protein HQ523_11420 [Lentisphaerae bacterium]|nr:hypothetical protein [Lentisphaerota bacterium]
MILSAGVALLVLAGVFHKPLLKARMPSVSDQEGLSGAPPVVVFTTVVLGGFRGIIADALWLRASYLQDEGRFLELVQLADWITKLEPHTSDIWVFHAWNLAYNISVMMPLPEDRWRWVQQGLHLLRDEGVRYNPSDPRIYQELGWLFQHKLGGESDRLHAYYKIQWAHLVADQLGRNGRPDYDELSRDPARTLALHQALGLDPARMQVVDALYGPLDWRVPQSHAVYWAYRGLQVAGSDGYLPCSRMIYQSMAELFVKGRLTWGPGDTITMLADARLLPGVMRAYEDALSRYEGVGVRESYANFLVGATLMLHARGDSRRSRNCFDRLHGAYPTPQTADGYEAFIAAYGPRPGA